MTVSPTPRAITTPVILFTYARPNHTRRTLDALRANYVPLIYAFSDGPKTPTKAPLVDEVRRLLHDIDWCEVVICERETNWGLGKSILAGVNEVLAKHDSVLIMEDDLVCVPGAYAYMAAALDHYRNDPDVMSVTAWNHPKVTPSNITDQPYFDGRAECLMWGTWARGWKHMDMSAMTLLEACADKGIDVNRYGMDLPYMAAVEQQKNIWAVRWLYAHLLEGGLCFRPPWNMVEHIGYDAEATNTPDAGIWADDPPKTCPPIPEKWPAPIENRQCPKLWQTVYDHPSKVRQRKLKARLKPLIKPFIPPIAVQAGRTAFSSLRGGKGHALKMILPPILIPTRDDPAKMKQKPEWEYVPEGWKAQQTDPAIKGWNVQSIVDTTVKRWPDFVNKLSGTYPLGISPESKDNSHPNIYHHNLLMCYAYALGVAARLKSRLSMLDWGGSMGHYFVISKALFPDLDIDYHCKDLPLLVEQGKKMLPNAHFYSDDDAALNGVYDFVLASSVLQYAENWQEMLCRLAVATKGYIFVTRLPTIHRVPSYVMIQRPYMYGYNTEYLGWCINRNELVKVATSAGLHLLREFVVEAPPYIVNAPEQCTYWGYLFQKDMTHETN